MRSLDSYHEEERRYQRRHRLDDGLQFEWCLICLVILVCLALGAAVFVRCVTS